MARVLFPLIAEQDLDEIETYVSHDNPTAAEELTELLFEKCRLLATQPEIGRARPELAEHIRSFPVGNYIIFYRPAQDGIEGARVLRGSRNVDDLF